MKYIIIDLKTTKALYGINNKTLSFSTYDIAEEVAKQFFNEKSDYLIISCYI